MKWLIRKRPESDVIWEHHKDGKEPLWEYLPFVKGTSVDERKNENILDRVTLVVSLNDL